MKSRSLFGKVAGAGQGGFAFISVVAAAAILAVAAFLLGGLMVRSLQDQRSSEKGSQAVLLAQEKAEDLKSLPFDQVKPEPEGEVSGYPGFKCSVDVEDIDSCTKRVTVRVSYPLQGSDKRGEQVLAFERSVNPEPGSGSTGSSPSQPPIIIKIQ